MMILDSLSDVGVTQFHNHTLYVGKGFILTLASLNPGHYFIFVCGRHALPAQTTCSRRTFKREELLNFFY